jgi:hypothetical protein
MSQELATKAWLSRRTFVSGENYLHSKCVCPKSLFLCAVLLYIFQNLECLLLNCLFLCKLIINEYFDVRKQISGNYFEPKVRKRWAEIGHVVKMYEFACLKALCVRP